ncbi:hypothetical protein BJ508DRAFT_29869 [Ascobolus immersus RN42]|uniref:Uncharacterized protein n=1 Tax=Ascobolus immersus RN42 TaxID=1160509 RepID=A0A3N4HLZ9_ASCIM|nr:hypothetical protein BJ508DRAFT_29869 [Ascobolus immersus RN42]
MVFIFTTSATGTGPSQTPLVHQPRNLHQTPVLHSRPSRHIRLQLRPSTQPRLTSHISSLPPHLTSSSLLHPHSPRPFHNPHHPPRRNPPTPLPQTRSKMGLRPDYDPAQSKPSAITIPASSKPLELLLLQKYLLLPDVDQTFLNRLETRTHIFDLCAARGVIDM